MPDYKYLMKVAIDFGSTNTVMAWRVYHIEENGKLVLSDKLNPISAIKRIPSMMIFKSDNPQNEAVKKDLYGDAAAEVVRNSNTPPVVCDNFKQCLYTAAPGSAEYTKGIALCTRFFEFLREEYKQGMYNILPPHVTQELKVVLYLSTPVRAHPTHRTLMRKMAEDAGFNAANGITEINTDLDEARCVIRYAMEHRKDDMRDVMAKAGKPKGAILLFVDVGGSTMDVSLENLRIDLAGNETMDNISCWPNADVKYPLGGAQIDEAIKDYLIAQGYADSEFTREKWIHGDGKFRFRVFKEESNELLQSGQTITKLGKVASVCYDYDDDIVPPKNYAKSTEQIDCNIYESKICHVYIDKMLEAIAALFSQQRLIPGRARIAPGDVDAIFLAGDGSRLYFISQILRGERMGKDPGFSQIKVNPKLLFDKWDNPSHCCALGALADQEKLISPNYARDRYFAEVSVFEHSAWLTEQFRSQPSIMTSQDYVLGDRVGKCNRIYFSSIPITEKYQLLPQIARKKEKFSYTDYALEMIAIRVSLYRVAENGRLEQVGMPFVLNQQRQMGRVLQTVLVAASKLEKFLQAQNGAQSGIPGKMRQFLGQITGPTEATVEAEIAYRFTMSENNHLKFEVALSSQHFNIPVSTVKMDL